MHAFIACVACELNPLNVQGLVRLRRGLNAVYMHLKGRRVAATLTDELLRLTIRYFIFLLSFLHRIVSFMYTYNIFQNINIEGN